VFRFLVNWDPNFAKSAIFYDDLLPVLGDLCFGLERVGSLIDHASSDLVKAVWNQAVTQTMKYVRNIGVYISSMKQLPNLDQTRFSKSVSLLVSMLLSLSGCVVITREWCPASTSAAACLLFWLAAESVSDTVVALDGRRVYVRNISADRHSAIASRQKDIQNESTISANFILSLTNSVFRSVSTAAPAPQELQTAIARVVARSSQLDFDPSGARDLWGDPSARSHWYAVSQTVLGLTMLLKAAANVSGER
jgi:hypothetical protein